MTLPIKKSINTEVIIDRTAALYVVEGRLKNMERVVNQLYWLIRGLSIPNAKRTKRYANEKPSGILFQNDFNGNVTKIIK